MKTIRFFSTLHAVGLILSLALGFASQSLQASIGTAPEIAVEQPLATDIPDAGSIDYGNVLVGTSSSFTYTIKNTGDGDLIGISITKSGANEADFTIITPPAATVVPGDSTTFVLEFTPGGTGSRSAAIQIANDDSDESPFDINLTGIGTTPEISVEQPLATDIPNAGSQSYGSVLVGTGSSLTYTIKNTGDGDLTGISIIKSGTHAADFTVTTPPAATVAPGDSTTFALEFTPGAVGTRSAAIHIVNNDSDENPFGIEVTGTGIAPEIAVQQPLGTDIVDSGTMSYGGVLVGTSSSLTYTIKNTGDVNLTGIAITKIGTHAADFSVITAPAATVVPGGSTLFILKFTPGGVGSRSAAIQISSNDGDEDPFDIVVTGTGTMPEIAVEQPLATSILDAGSKSYGSVLVGTSSSLTYTIKNTGDGNLTGLAITKSGTNAADFTVTTAPAATVAPGGSTLFVVKFTPGDVGSRSAAIQISNNDSDEKPFDINLSGTGTAPEIAVEQPLATNIPDAGSKSYGNVLVGTSSSLTYTIKNTGNGNLTGIAITKSGTNAADFTVTTAPAATVAPGGSTTFVLKFTPGGTGSRSAAIQIANNDSNEKPFDIILSGTGTAPEIAVEQPLATDIPDAGSKSYGSVPIGTSSSLTYTIKNTGTGNLTGIAITKSGTHSADFSVTTAPATTVAPDASTTFVVKFTPGGTGSRNAAIQIANNDSNEKPFDIILSGTGTAPEIAVQQPLGTEIVDMGSKSYGNVL
ncbi:MAG TPA: choice-of-anchor D domain-containing protein, partial [Luteolibacter sp.]